MSSLKYMIGPRFGIIKEGDRFFNGFISWYVGFGFYWFCLNFFKRWEPNTSYESGRLCAWTGFVLYFSPNNQVQEGDLIWLKCKKWMWPDYPKATSQPLKEKE